MRVTRLEAVIEELAKKITILADGLEITRQELKLTRGEVGGLARSFGYAFENEAYRMLPKTLKEKYGIELTEKLIRTEIEDTKINIIGFGKRNSTEVVVIGEVKARLERMQVFDELAEKVRVVKKKYKNKEIVKVLVAHFATKNILKVASDTGIIVVQSFERSIRMARDLRIKPFYSFRLKHHQDSKKSQDFLSQLNSRRCGDVLTKDLSSELMN